MRIGIDASRTTGVQRTGTENYSLFLIRALLDLDSQNKYVLYSNRPPAEDLFAPADNVRQRVIPFPRLWTHVRLSLEMLMRPPDVLWVPAHVLPLVHPRSSVVTVHDLGYLHFPEAHTARARRYLDWSTRYNARHAARVIADSQCTREDLISRYHTPPDKIDVIYPGYDETTFHPRAETGEAERVRDRYALPETYALFVGTLQPRKNLATLIDAVRILLDRGTPVHLAIGGKLGWMHEQVLERIKDAGLDPFIHTLGYVPQDDLPALLRSARVFVLPSLYEGFGLPALEAMACGVPVVCSNTSSLPEVVGDAGLLVPPTSAVDLATAIEQVLSQPSLAADLARRGPERARRFSWAQAAEQVLRVLEEAHMA